MKIIITISILLFLQNSICETDNFSSNTNSVQFSCITNISCIKKKINDMESGQSLNVGFFKVVNDKDSNSVTRQFSTGLFSNLKGKSIKFQLGNNELCISASHRHNNYLEFVLLKKNSEGRSSRKRLQMFVPAFMVASQVGWYMLALKLVSTLAIKALLVAKLAFFVAALITIKKLILEPMHVSSPITPFYDHVDPYIVPFDFSTLGHQDFHPLSIAHLGHSETPLASASVLHQSNHIPVEGSTIALNESRSGDSTTASSLSQTKSNKRTDFLQGRQPFNYYNFSLKSPYIH